MKEHMEKLEALVPEFEEEMGIVDMDLSNHSYLYRYIIWLEDNLIHERAMRDMDSVPDNW